MNKRDETILRVIAGVSGLALLVGTFIIDLGDIATVPIWYWAAFVIALVSALAIGTVNDLKSTPTRNNVITNLVIGALFLFVYLRSPDQSVVKVFMLAGAILFVVSGGIRFARLIALGARS